jgi:5-methylcytosine-specific restriction endonuclease McrA
MQEKRCSRCRKVKSIAEFRKGGKGTRGDGFYAYCKECSREYDKNRRIQNPEATRAKRHRYYIRHKADCYRRNAEWVKNNPERKQKINQRYNETHPGANVAAVRDWRHRNPSKTQHYRRTRRAREHGAEGNYTEKEWIDLCNKYNNRCAACGKPAKLTVDHIVPLIQGGTNYIENIQPLCRSCNSRKFTRTIRFQGTCNDLMGKP